MPFEKELDNEEERLAKPPEATCAEWIGGSLPPLSSWFPALRAETPPSDHMALRSPTPDFCSRLTDLIDRFRLGRLVEVSYLELVAHADPGREAAITELCLGQLLISSRQQRAWHHLDRGFELAIPWFRGSEYLEVMRRHALLRLLPLRSEVISRCPGSSGRRLTSLEELLREAAVIQRLERSRAPAGTRDHRGNRCDTLG